MRIFLPLLVFSFCHLANAEYRAFLLEITDKNQRVLRKVTSTLDWIQYPRFHPLNEGEFIRMADSWMCWERSDHFTPICRSPRALANDKTQDEARNP